MCGRISIDGRPQTYGTADTLRCARPETLWNGKSSRPSGMANCLPLGMFRRLLTEEEDREMHSVEYTAVAVDRGDISKYVVGERAMAVPYYLKRVGKQDGQPLVLVNPQTRVPGELVRVRVPAFAPCTAEQYRMARSIWPCHYYGRVEERVDVVTVDENMLRLINDPKYRGILETDEMGCSGICMIFDGAELLACEYDTEPVLGHAILAAVSGVSRIKRGYLCTGFSAFLCTEPCLSCAMALVHGRIKSVFCVKKKSQGPFSQMRFNYNKSLNHRYNVYFWEN